MFYNGVHMNKMEIPPSSSNCQPVTPPGEVEPHESIPPSLEPIPPACRQSALLLSSQELREIYLDFSCRPLLSGCLPKCSTGHSGRVVINSLTLNLVVGPPSQTRCFLWYSSGKSAVRVASHLLIGLEACSTRGVGIWYYNPSQRS